MLMQSHVSVKRLKGEAAKIGTGKYSFEIVALFTLPSLFEYPYTLIIVLALVLAISAMVAVVFYKKRKKNVPTQQQSQPPPKHKTKPTNIAKHQVENNTLKFYALKGIFKKRWVTTKEIHVNEISEIETHGSTLSITSNGVTNMYSNKKNPQSLKGLPDQIKTLQEEHQKNLEREQWALLRKNDLVQLLGSSLRLVDLSFDVLVGLQQKRVDWNPLDGYSAALGENFSFNAQTMPLLNLDFTGVSQAISRQSSKETSREAYAVLKVIYNYFEGLPKGDPFKDVQPNFEVAKFVILAYYALNDLLLGRIVGEKDDRKEKELLATVLQELADKTGVVVAVEELVSNEDMPVVAGEVAGVFADARLLFKERFKQFFAIF